ncbi:MAG: hypothetical protein AB7U82_34875 [Blastocatellales bacterium]
MSQTINRIERRLQNAKDSGAAARAKGDYLYAVHNQTMADELQWLLDAAATDDEVLISREAAAQIAAFLTGCAPVEFDEFLRERKSALRRSQIIEQLIEHLSEPRGA